MKQSTRPPLGTALTLENVLDRLATADLPASRRRDLRSAVMTYAKLVDGGPASIALDLAEIRGTLDRLVPSEAALTAKRWSNLRSDLASAIAASGLVPMLRTASLPVDPLWEALLEGTTPRVRAGLSRFARWASLRQVSPEAVDDAIMAKFMTELAAATLVRSLRDLKRTVARSWNDLARQPGSEELKPVTVPSFRATATRIEWEKLPASFRDDVANYLGWCKMSDPLDEGARARALAPRTRELRRNHIHSAVTAAVAAGTPPDQLGSLAALVRPEVVKVLLRHLWKRDGGKLSAYTHGVAGSLVSLSKEWAKLSPDQLEPLKELRRKLGSLPIGLTPKNENFLRLFDDPRRVREFIDLPDRLWREARRQAIGPGRAFLLFQDSLAIDILIHAPLRMENLVALNYDSHLHWVQGPGKPALLVIGADEMKNSEKIDLELPATLADRLLMFRSTIAPQMIGSKPKRVFVTWTGTPRGQATLARAISKAVRRRLGLKLSPHQLRHLVAKIFLDRNPGGFEVVRQLLGHKNLKTTVNFYAGINTRRAGRAHAKLLMQIKEEELAQPRRRRTKRKTEE